KGSDIALGGDRFDRRKFFGVKRSLRGPARIAAPYFCAAFVLALMHAFPPPVGRRGRLRCFGGFPPLTPSPPPARREVFRLAHSRPLCIGPRRASASGSARSRSRLWNGCSI